MRTHENKETTKLLDTPSPGHECCHHPASGVRGALPPIRFGAHTFRAEVGPSHKPLLSRTIHWPGGGASGVTLGPGYDMGLRSAAQVVQELMQVGVPRAAAETLAKGAGLRGIAAQRYVALYRHSSPQISEQIERQLFTEVTTPEVVRDVKRILAKPDTVAAYGAIRWDALPQTVQELLFDLRYRGDYTPTTRRLLHPLIAAGDTAGLRAAVEDRAFWRARGVPEGRISARIELLNLGATQ